MLIDHISTQEADPILNLYHTSSSVMTVQHNFSPSSTKLGDGWTSEPSNTTLEQSSQQLHQHLWSNILMSA